MKKVPQKKFAVLMNGRNFLMEMDGKTEKYGFYQTFFLNAVSPHDAEMQAVNQIRNQDDLRKSTLNPNDDPPTIHLDEIKEMDTFDGVDKTVTGRAWYREAENQ